MKVIHSDKHLQHDGGMELHRGELVPCFEKPARVAYILDAVHLEGWPVLPPREFPESVLERVHDAGLISFLRSTYDEWQAEGRDGHMLPGMFPARGMRRDRVPKNLHARMGYYAFDAGTPIMKGSWEAALTSAQCALTAAALVTEGESASYALCRPPGHHAAHASYGGYCFLNNAALAAQFLRDAGFAKVAVLDIDYHHGNGTQDIFWERDDVLCVSIHGDPATEYPFFLGYADERGTDAGEGFNLNLPLPRGTDWPTYQRALEQALEAIAAFAPTALVVSLGVDTFEQDPISAFALKEEHFPLIGKRLAALGLPTVLVQEGGYAVEAIGRNVAAVLRAFHA